MYSLPGWSAGLQIVRNTGNGITIQLRILTSHSCRLGCFSWGVAHKRADFLHNFCSLKFTPSCIQFDLDTFVLTCN